MVWVDAFRGQESLLRGLLPSKELEKADSARPVHGCDVNGSHAGCLVHGTLPSLLGPLLQLSHCLRAPRLETLESQSHQPPRTQISKWPAVSCRLETTSLRSAPGLPDPGLPLPRALLPTWLPASQLLLPHCFSPHAFAHVVPSTWRALPPP